MTSTLSRHRPAVLTVVTITLGCSLWYAYSAYHTKPAVPLHRSNAVHRRQNPVRNAQASAGTNDGDESTAVSRDQNESASPDRDDTAETVAGSEQIAQQPSARDGTSLKELLYYIAEDQSRLNGYIHRGVMCNGCYMKPIRGVRWRCANCADYDLCSDCEATGMHSKTHIFYKVKIPAPFLGNPRQSQPVAYPGKPEEMSRELPAEISKQLAATTGFEKEEVDALYDQFTCLANTPWPDDTLDIDYAIDRRAFDTAFIPLFSFTAPGSNLLYDRVFAFYDTDRNGLIGFEELLVGLAHVQQKSRDPARRRLMIFNGFDLDGDNYISRRDVLRLFRAYYAIQKDITHDLIAVQEEEFELKNVNTLINSSQPLSAIFTEPPPPASLSNGSLDQKPPNQFGERRHGTNALFESSNDQCQRTEVLQASVDEAVELGDRTTEQSHEDEETILEDILRGRSNKSEFYTDAEEGWLPSPEQTTVSSALRTPLGHVRNASIWYESTGPERRLVEKLGDPASRSSTSDYVNGSYQLAVNVPDTSVADEILYQVILEGLNELLDPLFKQKEDLALEARECEPERKKWNDLVIEYTATLNKDDKKVKDENPSAKVDGSGDHDRSEPVTPIESKSSKSATSNSTLKPASKDPTMPQFKPNSLNDMLAIPSAARIKRFHELNIAQQAIDEAGGPGRLSLKEFTELMDGELGRKLAFVESWFELGSF